MSAQPLTIGAHALGPGNPAYIVAEIGQAHDGSLGNAHAYIDAVARTGASAVKFQTHIAHAESTPEETFRVNVFPQDRTRYDYWRRMEFTKEQWIGLAEHARDRNLAFLSTPFSIEAVELLEAVGVPAWKIGSGDIANWPLLECVSRTKLPVLLSSGLSTWEELDAAVSCVRKNGAPVAVMQCTTSYPCPAEKTGLNVIGELRSRYECPVGLSDHSGTIFASLAAVTLGANLLEVHTAFSRECFGPDVSSSVTTSELVELVRGVRFIETALSHPVTKDREAAERERVKTLFGRSLVTRQSLAQGHVLQLEDVAFKKPGTGIPAARLSEFVGRRLVRPVQPDQILKEADFE